MSKLTAGRKKIFFWYWLPFFIYAGFIFYLSSLPVRANLDVPNLDKVFHIGEYIVFGLFFSRAMQKSFPQTSLAKYYFWVISIAFCYGFSDELHQLFVPNREFSLFDVLADIFGAVCGGRLYGLRAV
ncbi:MAG: VanZ family protein [Candidatus Omnitrophota bacterium]|nr:VanZ family protein [Candidatus Omnitrophota bacterium]